MSEITPIVTSETATITTTVKFVRIHLVQNNDGTYGGQLQYRRVRSLGDMELSSELLDPVALDQATLLGSSEGQAAFPLIQAFCRKAQASVTPELFQ